MNKRVKVTLDNWKYSSKPTKKELGIITYRLLRNPVDLEIKQLAQEILKGKSFTPATFKKVNGELRRKNANWKSQQIIALDIDEGLTLEEARNDGFFIENAAFLYTTFRHSIEQNKFRVIFVLEEPLYDYIQFKKVMDYLFEKYPYADKACGDGARLYFGGKSIHVFNYNNKLSVDDLIYISPVRDIESNLYISHTPLSGETPTVNPLSPANLDNNNLQLIVDKDVTGLKEVINAEPIVLYKNEVMDYLKQQDLRKFLGINAYGTFIDIFHDESQPSASIYLSNKENGHWLYKCHSSSYPFCGTIIQIIQRLLESNLRQALEFLVEVYNIEIQENEKTKEIQDSLELYKQLLMSDDLEVIHPNFFKVFNRYGHIADLYKLLDLIKEYIQDDEEPRILFYHSIQTISKHIGKSKTSTGTRINFFVLFCLLKKLDEKEVPEELLTVQKINKQQKHYKYLSSTYELPLYSYDLFCEIDKKCGIWLEKGCSSRTISYEGIYRVFGKEEADRVFPQDKGKEINEMNSDIVMDIHKVTIELIQEKGWVTQQEILDSLKYRFKGQLELKTKQLKRCLGEMLDAYDYELIPCNKALKEELGITEEMMNKNSFPKIIRKKLREVDETETNESYKQVA